MLEKRKGGTREKGKRLKKKRDGPLIKKEEKEEQGTEVEKGRGVD